MTPFFWGESGTSTHEVHRDASKNFSIFIDQYSQKEGVYITTYKLPEGSQGEDPVSLKMALQVRFSRQIFLPIGNKKNNS